MENDRNDFHGSNVGTVEMMERLNNLDPVKDAEEITSITKEARDRAKAAIEYIENNPLPQIKDY